MSLRGSEHIRMQRRTARRGREQGGQARAAHAVQRLREPQVLVAAQAHQRAHRGHQRASIAGVPEQALRGGGHCPRPSRWAVRSAVPHTYGWCVQAVQDRVDVETRRSRRHWMAPALSASVRPQRGALACAHPGSPARRRSAGSKHGWTARTLPRPCNAWGRAAGTIFLMTAHRKSATRCCGTHARMSAAWSARGSAASGAGPPPGCAWLAPAQHGAAVHRLGMLPRVSVPPWLPGLCVGSRPGPPRPQPAPALARGLRTDESCVRGPTQPSRPATPDGSAQRGGSAGPGSCVSASAARPLRAWLSLSGAGAPLCEALWLRGREHLLPWPQPRPGACAAGRLCCDQQPGGPRASWLGFKRRRRRGRGPSTASDPRSSDEAGPMRPSPLAHARPAPALPASQSGRGMLPGSLAAAAGAGGGGGAGGGWQPPPRRAAGRRAGGSSAPIACRRDTSGCALARATQQAPRQCIEHGALLCAEWASAWG